MAKASRVALRVAAGLVLVTAAACLLCLDGIDYQPYFKAPYYQQTSQRLHALATNQNLVTGELAAGFGRALLTPTLHAVPVDPTHGRFGSLPLAGYGNRQGRPATGTHDDLYVKAVAFRVDGHVAVMVSADALIIPREVAEAAMARLGPELHLHREQVYFSATHTHSSLGGWGEGMVAEAFAGPFQPGVRGWMAGQIIAAVQAAVANLRPASLGQGSVFVPEYCTQPPGRLAWPDGRQLQLSDDPPGGGRPRCLGVTPPTPRSCRAA